jgi:hypothetical protein
VAAQVLMPKGKGEAHQQEVDRRGSQSIARSSW